MRITLYISASLHNCGRNDLRGVEMDLRIYNTLLRAIGNPWVQHLNTIFSRTMYLLRAARDTMIGTRNRNGSHSCLRFASSQPVLVGGRSKDSITQWYQRRIIDWSTEITSGFISDHRTPATRRLIVCSCQCI